MKRAFFLMFLGSVLIFLSGGIFAQTLEELLKVVEDISDLNYAYSLSSNSGITNMKIDGKGQAVFSSILTLDGTATVELEFSKSLSLSTSISPKNVGISLNFYPFRYDKAFAETTNNYSSEKMKLREEIINIFFDAMKRERAINQLSLSGTSLNNQAKIDLERSSYRYDLDMISELLNTKVEKLQFPKLSVPDIPKVYTPYYMPKKQVHPSTLSLGISADFSSTVELETSLEYSWSPKSSKHYTPNLLNIKKMKYFRDINILALIVRKYDERIANLFEKYSNVYGKYLSGEATKEEVDSLSQQISSLGYERDIYCIDLLKNWYLYTYFGE